VAGLTSGGPGKSSPVVSVAASREASKLDVYGRKDPFRALGNKQSVPKGPAPELPSAADPAGEDKPSSGSAAGSSPNSGSSTGGGTLSGGSSKGADKPKSRPKPKRKPKPKRQPKPKTTLYTYTADLTFGRSGRTKKYYDTKRLEMLPDDANPLLVFLGVTASRASAVFLVDVGTLPEQAGEGTCKPSRSTCSFLYLRADQDHNQHSFIDTEGNEYSLHLLSIDAEKVGAKRAKAGARAAVRKRGQRARGERKGGGLFGFAGFADDSRG
jgi:hypothetical protein